MIVLALVLVLVAIIAALATSFDWNLSASSQREGRERFRFGVSALGEPHGIARLGEGTCAGCAAVGDLLRGPARLGSPALCERCIVALIEKSNAGEKTRDP